MLNLFKALTVLALLSSSASLFRLAHCASIDNSKFVPADKASFDKLNAFDDSVDRSLNSAKPTNSIYSPNGGSPARSKLLLKRGPVDLDYNQDLVTKFEHPNGLISLNKEDNLGLNQMASDQQSASQPPPNYRQSKMSRLTNPRTTRIRFLVGSSSPIYGGSVNLQPSRSEPQSPDQPIGKKPNVMDNYLSEPSEPAFLYKRANGIPEDDYDSALLARKLRNQLNSQLNTRFGRPMSYGPPANSFYGRRVSNDPYSEGPMSGLSDQAAPDQSRRRIKKALSLFAHWKPKETSFLRANDFSSGISGFDAFNKISPRAPLGSNRRPHGAPLRWG